MAASVTSPLCSDIKGFLLSVFLTAGYVCVCVWGEASSMGSDVMGERDYRNLLRHASHSRHIHWATRDRQRHPSLMNAKAKAYTHIQKCRWEKNNMSNLHQLQTIPLCGNIKGTCWYANVAVLCTATVPACRDHSFSHCLPLNQL